MGTCPDASDPMMSGRLVLGGLITPMACSSRNIGAEIPAGTPSTSCRIPTAHTVSSIELYGRAHFAAREWRDPPDAAGRAGRLVFEGIEAQGGVLLSDHQLESADRIALRAESTGSAEIRMSENCRYTPHYGARIS